MGAPTTTLEQIKRDEGFRAFAYKCTGGKTTIGYGFNVDDGEGLPQDLADEWLSRIVNRVKTELVAEYEWFADWHNNRLPFVAPRYAAVVNMRYQLGAAGFRQFRKTHALLADRNWTAAAAEMLNSKWAQQTPKRAGRLAKQIETNEWQ